MNRAELIEKEAKLVSYNVDEYDYFILGARWADENPDKNLVYTKKELMDMGFGFDTNGNIRTPQEIEESHKKHNEYRKNRLIKKACEWLDHVNTDEYMDSGIFQMYDLIHDLKKVMEE